MHEVILGHAVADAIRMSRRELATFRRGDPYGRGRKIARGSNTERQARRKFFSGVAARRVEAQQEIEFWLRKRGVRWHTIMGIINREYDGKLSKIEDAMVRFGHVKGEAA